MPDLKPCPFCNTPVTTKDTFVSCPNCRYTFDDFSKDNTWWNTRPIEDKLKERLDDAKEDASNLMMILDNAIESYHDKNCFNYRNSNIPCDCGADEIIAAYKKHVDIMNDWSQNV